MQRLLLALAVLGFALYGSPAAFSTQAESAGAPPIALILPLQSKLFRGPAEAVRQGFAAAAQVAAPAPPVRLYPTGDDDEGILIAYRAALREGAAVVVGPLTRSGVAALARSGAVSIPTLALNAIAADNAPFPPNLYQFGLNIEGQARQVARFAYRESKPNAYIVSSGTPLARRIAQAFAQTWRGLGGQVEGEYYPFSSHPPLLEDLRQALAPDAAIVFLAAEAGKARLLRPYIDPALRIYATSLVYSAPGNSMANLDLEGVRFLDMPWLLEPDHPAVMVYPRPDLASAELERLYALGIDAFRIALALSSGPIPENFSLDGVTGRITLEPGHRFARQLIPAAFASGSVQLLEGSGR